MNKQTNVEVEGEIENQLEGEVEPIQPQLESKEENEQNIGVQSSEKKVKLLLFSTYKLLLAIFKLDMLAFFFFFF